MPARREISFRAARLLRFGVVLVVAIVGVLTIHAVFTAPASRAARPAAATTARAPGARLLLAGSSLYSYDIGTHRLQPLPLPLNTPASLLHLLPLRGGTILVTPAGDVFGANSGKPVKQLGVFAGVLADHDGDAVWLLTPTTAQLAGLAGNRYGKPYVIPAGRRVIAALDAGLLLGPAAPGRAGLINVVDPRKNRVVRTIAPIGIVLAAAGDTVAWSSCNGSGCTTEVTRIGSGQTDPLPALPTGYLPAGLPLLSPDNRHYAEPARRLSPGPVVLVVGRLATSTPARQSRVAFVQVAARVGAAQYARDGTLVVDTGRGLRVQRPRSRPGAPLTNLPDFTTFAVS